MALIANCNRDPKRRSAPYKPGEFSPFTPPPRQLTQAEKERIVEGIVKSWSGQ